MVQTIDEHTGVTYGNSVPTGIPVAAETWTLKDENKRSLRVFEMSVLRKILGCTRRETVYAMPTS